MSCRITYFGAIEYRNEQGLFHREDGPAIEYADGAKEWRQHGKLHRLDGPAIELVDGYKEWWVNGRYLSRFLTGANQLRQFNALLKLTLLQNKSRKFNEWLFDPDNYAGKWHKKNMLRDFQV